MDMSVLLSVKHKSADTREQAENGVLHGNMSLDMHDERAQWGATGRRTKASLMEAGILRSYSTCGSLVQWGQCVCGLGSLVTPMAEKQCKKTKSLLCPMMFSAS